MENLVLNGKEYSNLIFNGKVIGDLPITIDIYGKEMSTEDILRVMFMGEDEEGKLGMDPVFGEMFVGQMGEDAIQDGRLGDK